MTSLSPDSMLDFPLSQTSTKLSRPTTFLRTTPADVALADLVRALHSAKRDPFNAADHGIALGVDSNNGAFITDTTGDHTYFHSEHQGALGPMPFLPYLVAHARANRIPVDRSVGLLAAQSSHSSPIHYGRSVE